LLECQTCRAISDLVKAMKRTIFLMSAIVLCLTQQGTADVPAAFIWVNLESDAATMSIVRHALRDTSMSAIREVGVEDGFALAMTVSREAGAPTPDYDLWSIYSISLANGKSKIIVSGYGVKLLDWIGSAHDELAITYYDCWECEAATIFTTFHVVKGVGWEARWADDSANMGHPQPGAVVQTTGVGEPYDDDDAEQVFAVVPQPNGGFAAGNWLHSRNTQSGKISDYVKKYSIDPATKKDQIETLGGTAALSWEQVICTKSNVLIQPSVGQDTKACRDVVRTTSSHRAAHR
jgi:hypothetical protein